MPMPPSIHTASNRPAGWGIVPAGATSLAKELPIVLGGIGLFYSVIAFARYWSGPVSSQAEISLHPAALPKYALFSVLRLAIAYIFSFVFTLVYGYVAAYNRKAERFMIPLLDTLQSIPVLSFLPGVMISMAALWPLRRKQRRSGAGEADGALYAKPANAAPDAAFGYVADFRSGDVVQLVRTLPCHSY
jgi:hypothetical protein